MRILEENEINYNIEDIINAVNDELGFSMIRTSDSTGDFRLGSGIKLSVNFDNDIKVVLKFPSDEVDMSESYSQSESYSTAIESAQEIVDIIRRMTGEGEESDENS